MLDRIQSFFLKLAGLATDGDAPQDSLQVAVAALCYQIMEADGEVSGSEKTRLRELLAGYYNLDAHDAEALIAAGKAAGSEAVDYYRFTSDIRRRLDESGRVELLGILWDIVYADGNRSEMEDHVIWRVADLLGVSGQDRVAQRQQAAARRNIASGDDDQNAV